MWEDSKKDGLQVYQVRDLDTLEQGYGRIANRFSKVLGGKNHQTCLNLGQSDRGKEGVKDAFGFLAVMK